VDNISIKVLRNNVSFMHVPAMYVRFWRRMKDNFISEMNTFFNESPKCDLYRYILDNNVLQFYLDRPLNYIYDTNSGA
jgi:hypothetical protein